ncbi:hypothetical protein HFP89_06240 [Wenzhouxiangella sp. XN79A]|uniref:TolB family protein n=1 Tax=Wenzhouxiangella sp. XN79A TaxID=2724193 RepID=UPI00144ACAF9|nr:PD40 domain-containing protein [Wenzhouxiangella sp. XN79A]NKI34761.1 hypothetical protein [Wenzhouxiangella sp. XN79A]
MDPRFSSKRLLLVAGLVAGLIAPVVAVAQPVQLVSAPVDPDFFDGFGNDNSGGIYSCGFSDDGSRLVFSSSASNLVPDDRNGTFDVFVHDLGDPGLQLVSRTSAGEQADDSTGGPTISGDGRYVLFDSRAGNLGVVGAFQGFRRDLDTGTTVPISFAPDGSDLPNADPMDLSGDGNLAVFMADDQVWLRDIAQGTTLRVSDGIDGQGADDLVSLPTISGDGSRVAFQSAATNLVVDDTNGERDIFLRDLSLGTTTRIEGIGGAEPDGESELARISGDGGWIAFESDATNLVALDTNGQRDIFLHEIETGITTRISEDVDGIGGNAPSRRPAISPDGRFVVFESEADNLLPGLTGIERRLHLYDRQSDTLTRFAADAAFPQTPCITSTGNEGWVAYRTTAHPLIPPEIGHLQLMLEPFSTATPTGAAREGTTVVSRASPPVPVPIGNGSSLKPAIAAGGAFLAFRSDAGNLIGASPGGTQIVRLNLATGALEVASLGFDGEPERLSFPASDPSLSADGNRLAFLSRSPNLVPGDTNNDEDVFVRDIAAGQIVRISVSSSGDEADADSLLPVLSADGSAVAFRSTASNLVPGDGNGDADIFVRELAAGITERVSVNIDGSEADARSENPDISGTGRFVVFSSRADLLNPGGPLGIEQVWLRDRQLGVTELISSTPSGEPGNGASNRPRISASGRWIAFRSSASDLDPAFPGVTGSSIYLHDRQSGVTSLVSVDEAGNPVPVDDSGTPRLAADGSAVLFRRFIDPGGLPDDTGDEPTVARADPEGTLYVYHRLDQATTRVDPITVDGAPPDDWLEPAAIEPGGRVIYVVSLASNLVPAMVNGEQDIYRIDLDAIFADGFETPQP